jgi:hypothetical protein
MNGQRLMNLKDNDVLQLKGTTKNHELWEQIKKLQQFYSSNYRLWVQRQPITQPQQQQTIPMTASSYFAPAIQQAPIALRTLQPSSVIQSKPSCLTIPPLSIQPTTATTITTLPSSSSSSSSSSTTASSSTSSSSHTTLLINQFQNPQQHQQHQRNPSFPTSMNTTQTVTPTALLERSPLTVTRSASDQQHQRRSLSHSLSNSNTSINILPTSAIQRPTNTLLNIHRTPADQIEDQPMTDCCCIGSIRADRKKTLFACLLALCTLYFCSFVITIVDERLPDPKDFPPLPDLILDNVKQIPWAFSVTEKIILIEILTLITIIALHQHR